MKIINIWITWHRMFKLVKEYNDIKKLKKNIYQNIKKITSKYKDYEIIFHVWLADWIDNIIWEYCIKNKINYNIYIPLGCEEWYNKDNIKNYDDFFDYFWEFLLWWFFNYKTQKEAYNIYINKLWNIKSIWSWYAWRHKEIIENSEILLCWWIEEDIYSGTYQTINFAKEKGIPIYNLLNNNKKVD